MDLALAEAEAAAGHDDVPVGAVVVGQDGRVLGRGRNERERRGDPTAHAEVLALRAASTAAGRWRLDDCTLVVTLEPCAMCAGAAIAARVARCVLGAWDAKAGACGSVWDLPRDPRSPHRVEIIGGVAEEACAQVLRDFFVGRR
ncbi:MAG: nucleoside deaminase [Kineosporiaceae bacterium]